MAKINQAENFAGEFGLCLRSSATFWVPPNTMGKLRIALSDYWNFKNKIKVILVASYRTMGGSLIERHRIDFGESTVLVLNPEHEKLKEGGSVEIEAFAQENLRIPYAAIMAIYENKESISMLHSYTRSYSHWEIEEKRSISDGHEGCWTLRDSEDIYSFAVLHNGNSPQPEQIIKLVAKNSSGQTISAEIETPQLNQFETLMVKPVDYIPDLISFLDGKPGSATIDFKVKGSFSRLLVGWHSQHEQLQVTHSNFNYTIHETDLVNSTDQAAYMRLPITPFESRAVIYPEFSKGNYKVTAYDQYDASSKTFQLELCRSSVEGTVLEFCRADGLLPSRIVTAVERLEDKKTKTIPCECSLGVIHSKRPPKRFHWGVCHTHLSSNLLIVAYPEIYGNPEANCLLNIKCLLPNGNIYTKDVSWDQVKKGERACLCLTEVFPIISEFKDINDFSSYCYVTTYSAYGGFFMYTCIQKGDSWTLEHTF